MRFSALVGDRLLGLLLLFESSDSLCLFPCSKQTSADNGELVPSAFHSNRDRASHTGPEVQEVPESPSYGQAIPNNLKLPGLGPQRSLQSVQF